MVEPALRGIGWYTPERETFLMECAMAQSGLIRLLPHDHDHGTGLWYVPDGVCRALDFSDPERMTYDLRYATVVAWAACREYGRADRRSLKKPDQRLDTYLDVWTHWSTPLAASYLRAVSRLTSIETPMHQFTRDNFGLGLLPLREFDQVGRAMRRPYRERLPG